MPWKRVRINAEESKRYGLSVGDLVINRVNALSHLGKAALIDRLDEPAVYESNMMRIRLDPELADPTFVVTWLRSPGAKRQILAKAKKAINQASINQGDVRSMLMPKASIGVQRLLGQRITKLGAVSESVRRALAADDALFASLQSRAFSGGL